MGATTVQLDREPITAAKPIRLLVVEDNPADAELLVENLKAAGMSFVWERVATEPDFRSALTTAPDVILCDVALPTFGGSRALEILVDSKLTIPLLIVSGSITEELAVDFMQKGASDYLLKDRLIRLSSAVVNALERSRERRALRDADVRVQELLDRLDVGTVRTDMSGHVVDLNPALVRIFGFSSRAEFAPNFVDLLVTASDVDQFDIDRWTATADEAGAIKGLEISAHRKDGALIWISIDARLVRDTYANVAWIDAFVRDVTERRIAAGELATLHHRLDSALANAPIVMATSDANAVVTFIGGRGVPELLAKQLVLGQSALPLLRLVGGEASFRRAAAGEEHIGVVSSGGRAFQVHWNPIQETSGVVSGVAVVALDITARLEAEDQLALNNSQKEVIIKLAREAQLGVQADVLMRHALEAAADTIGVEFSNILELEPDEVALVQRADVGFGDGIVWMPLEPGSSAAFALRSEAPMVVEDYESEKRFSPPTQLVTWGIQSTLAVSLQGSDRVFGLLQLHSRRPRKWSKTDIEFVQLLGNFLVVAIERQRADSERRRLMSRLVAAQEEERRRIAGDIHDDAVQVMAAANLRLGLHRRHLAASLDETQKRDLDELEKTITLAIGRLRHLLFELSPPALERSGLAVALKVALEQLAAGTSLKTELLNDLREEPDPDHALVLYRIAQETLANVHKHAQAKTVRVSLTSEGNGVMVRVEDDGVGFLAAHDGYGKVGHLGLASMRERSEMAGGWWRLRSVPDRGTTVEFWIPPSTRAEPDEVRRSDIA